VLETGGIGNRSEALNRTERGRLKKDSCPCSVTSAPGDRVHGKTTKLKGSPGLKKSTNKGLANEGKIGGIAKRGELSWM